MIISNLWLIYFELMFLMLTKIRINSKQIILNFTHFEEIKRIYFKPKFLNRVRHEKHKYNKIIALELKFG